jgi:hypothetical protein
MHRRKWDADTKAKIVIQGLQGKPVADLLGIEPDQLHEGFIAEQQHWQRIHALNAKERLQAVEQDILDEGEHFSLDGRTVDLRQQGHHAYLVQEVEKVIQYGPFIQPVNPIDQLLAIQAARDAGIIPTGHLPAQSLGQILGDLIVGVWHRPPPFAEDVSAIEESGL